MKRHLYITISVLGILLTAPLSLIAESEMDTAEIEQIEALPNPRIIAETFGHLIAKNLEMPGFQFDIDSVIKGIREEAEGKPSPLTEKAYEEAVSIIEKQCFDSLAEQNLQLANEFFLKNKSEYPNILEPVSGKLQVQIVKEGKGPLVEEKAKPLLHYVGSFIDGTLLSSSYDSGDPVPLDLEQAIEGLSKGLVGAREGEIRRLVIHPDLAYGISGLVPPNSLLIFDVEIIKCST